MFKFQGKKAVWPWEREEDHWRTRTEDPGYGEKGNGEKQFGSGERKGELSGTIKTAKEFHVNISKKGGERGVKESDDTVSTS